MCGRRRRSLRGERETRQRSLWNGGSKNGGSNYGSSDNSRQLTLILYANDGGDAWDTERDGGCLRLEELHGASAVDVAPVAGRLVLFESARIWHRVMPSRRLRFAITLWVYATPPVERDGERHDDAPPPKPRVPDSSSAAAAVRESASATPWATATLRPPPLLLTLATGAGGRTLFRWVE